MVKSVECVVSSAASSLQWANGARPPIHFEVQMLSSFGVRNVNPSGTFHLRSPRTMAISSGAGEILHSHYAFRETLSTPLPPRTYRRLPLRNDNHSAHPSRRLCYEFQQGSTIWTAPFLKTDLLPPHEDVATCPWSKEHDTPSRGGTPISEVAVTIATFDESSSWEFLLRPGQ